MVDDSARSFTAPHLPQVAVEIRMAAL